MRFSRRHRRTSVRAAVSAHVPEARAARLSAATNDHRMLVGTVRGERMRRLVLVMVAVPMFGIVACGGSSYSTPVTPTNLVTNGTFTATVAGTTWGALGRVVVSRPTANSVSLFAGPLSHRCLGRDWQHFDAVRRFDKRVHSPIRFSQ